MSFVGCPRFHWKMRIAWEQSLKAGGAERNAEGLPQGMEGMRRNKNFLMMVCCLLLMINWRCWLDATFVWISCSTGGHNRKFSSFVRVIHEPAICRSLDTWMLAFGTTILRTLHKLYPLCIQLISPFGASCDCWTFETNFYSSIGWSPSENCS